MGLRTTLRNWLTGEDEFLGGDVFVAWQQSKAEYSVRELAFQTAVGRIAGTLSRSEIKTYVKGEETKGLDWYRFNVGPNKNQDAPAWLKDILGELYEKNECLILNVDNDLIVADSFIKVETALFPRVFRNVTATDFKFDRSFYQDRNCIYLQLNDANVKKILDQVYESYVELMGAAKDVIIASGSTKGILSGAGMRGGNENERTVARDIMENRMKPLWENRNAVIPLPQGFSYQDLSKDKSWAGTRDYRAQIDDIYDMTAAAFGIPPIVLKGQQVGTGTKDSYDGAYDVYLADAVGPIKKILETGFTRHIYSKEEVINGSKVRIDTSGVKHFDLFDIGGAVEKLIGSGALTINEVRRRVGYAETDDPVADMHLITKNFGTVEDVKGIETDGNKKEEGDEDES